MRRITAITLLVFLCGITGAAARPSAAPAPLVTANDCMLNAVKGKVEICHRTNSATKPFEQHSVSVSACIEGHGGHENDVIVVDHSCPGD